MGTLVSPWQFRSFAFTLRTKDRFAASSLRGAIRTPLPAKWPSPR